MSQNKPISSTEETRKLTISTSHCVPATKQFVVNATGNLFLATTLSSPNTPEELSEEAKKAFGQVSVFFAALTRAMSENGHSLFDYEALNKVVERSGMFVNVTQSEIAFETRSYGTNFSNDLVQALLGIGGNLAKALGDSLLNLVSSMGSEALTIAYDDERTDTRVGTIIFVCEYLMGAVSITPIVFSIDANDSKTALEIGPCFNTKSNKTHFTISKEVHLFVPPEFITYAKNLNDAMSSVEFDKLVINLQDSIQEEGEV